MACTIAIVNKKGGVGKTTTAFNLAGILAADYDKRVLAVDLDSQANLTISFKVNIMELPVSMSEVFLRTATLEDIAIPVLDRIHLAPARTDLAKVVGTTAVQGFGRLNEILKFRKGNIQELYDYIIIDTPPDVESVLTKNGLAISDFVVAPLKACDYSLAGITGVTDAVESIKSDFINTDIKVLGFLLTLLEHTSLTKKNLGLIDETQYGPHMFKVMIRKNAALPECVSAGKPISLYRRNCPGYWDYRAFTEELLDRIRQVHGSA